MKEEASVMKTEVIPTHEYPTTVADEIVASINEVLEEQPRCTLCLAGGTTPASVYRLLGLPPRVNEVSWQQVALFWGDERYVPYEDSRSNQRMVHDTLLPQFRAIPSPEAFAVNTALPTVEQSAEDYENTLHAQGISGEGEEVFDIVLLGIGEDGHTASLFPNMPVPEERLVFSCSHPSDGTSRISLTPKALFSAKRIFFLVMGVGKAEIVGRIFSGDGSPTEIPALYGERAADRTLWFLDSESAGAL